MVLRVELQFQLVILVHRGTIVRLLTLRLSCAQQEHIVHREVPYRHRVHLETIVRLDQAHHQRVPLDHTVQHQALLFRVHQGHIGHQLAQQLLQRANHVQLETTVELDHHHRHHVQRDHSVRLGQVQIKIVQRGIIVQIQQVKLYVQVV